MNMKERRDLNISGMLGGCGGGSFNNVTINGNGTIQDSLDCIRFVSNGRAVVRGTMKAESAVVNGIASFGDNVIADKFRSNGKTDIEGALTAKDFRSDGHMKIGGAVTAEEVQLNGSMTLRGNCDAERFHSRGSFRIDGLLNAGSVRIELYAECRVKEIGGESIDVRKSGAGSPFGKLIKALGFSKDALIAELIEGDDIRLEHTKADVVRGTNVVIGPGCEIGLVEYQDRYELLEDSSVKQSKQL
ncbi:hypothetical protein ACFFNY_29715 [Paenibacillus hodogayensis]|uniref:Polymer-forming cytoskeletal protein n=1 Tax=Paenibacillus hodogayensis TaxID=279208 RepID=A0ABV5W5C9_9BACL